MTTKDEMIAARQQGRAALPGDPNPHAGNGLLAQLWRLGYQTMLLDKLNSSPARQKYLQGISGE